MVKIKLSSGTTGIQWIHSELEKKKILFNMCLRASGHAQLKFRVWTILKLTYKIIDGPWAFHLLTTPLKPFIDDYPPKDSGPPGSYVHGILQARILEWVAVFSSRGSSQPRDRICNSDISCNAGDPCLILGQEDPLEKGKATHSNILSWRIPWTVEPGRLQSLGSQRVIHDY